MATLEMTMYVLGIRLDGTYTGHRVELEPMRSRQATGEVVSCAKALFRTSIDLTGYSSPQAAANGRWEEERDRFWGCLALVSTGETWIDVNGQATVDGQPCGLHHETDMSVEAPTLQELSQEMMFSSRVGMVAILQKMHLDLLDALDQQRDAVHCEDRGSGDVEGHELQ
jgi:hypothetical protein